MERLLKLKNFNIKRPDIESTVAYVERHLSRYRQKARVIINERECQFEEPLASEEYTFSPPPDIAKHIGRVKLIVRVSPIPLDSENNGIDIFSNGIWHETTLVGLQNERNGQYLFGEVEVPILEEKEWPIPPFDNTRNNALNASNPIVAVLFGWIAQEARDSTKSIS